MNWEVRVVREVPQKHSGKLGAKDIVTFVE
jgi:hypothetical protein